MEEEEEEVERVCCWEDKPVALRGADPPTCAPSRRTTWRGYAVRILRMGVGYEVQPVRATVIKVVVTTSTSHLSRAALGRAPGTASHGPRAVGRA